MRTAWRGWSSARLPGADREQVAQITALSGGVPFAVHELARRAAAEPEWVQALDANMVTGIEPATREVLQRVAIAGASFDTDEFVALVRACPKTTRARHLDRALAALVVEPTSTGYRFRHGLVRDALLEDLPPHRRRRIHRDAAERLIELDASASRIAPSSARVGRSGSRLSRTSSVPPRLTPRSARTATRWRSSTRCARTRPARSRTDRTLASRRPAERARRSDGRGRLPGGLGRRGRRDGAPASRPAGSRPR